MTRELNHLRAIEQAIAELQALNAVTAAPASMQYQYVGTIVDNTLVLLLGAANSIDQGVRMVRFTEFDNWVSVMAAVHRSFYSSLHSAVEISLSSFCTENGIDLTSGRSKKAEKLIAELGDNLTDKQKVVIRGLAGSSLAFNDYVHAVTKAKITDRSKRSEWNKFFDALSILRNKASHSDPTPSDSEKKRLEEGGFGDLLYVNGELRFNPTKYRAAIDKVLNFFDDIGA